MRKHSVASIAAMGSALTLSFAAALPAAAQDREFSVPTELPSLPSAARAATSLPGMPHVSAPSLPANPLPGLPPVSGADTRPEWRGPPPAPSLANQVDPRAKAAWLDECRRRSDDYYGRGRGHGSGIIGALIGGLAGGVIGNRIDDGPDRAGGTIGGAVLGAAVGAIAGNAIGKRSRRGDRDYDYCEAYFDDYYAHYQYQAYAPPAYGYGQAYYQAPMVRRAAAQPCTEEVVTEEYVPVRSRVIYRAAPVRRTYVPTKRIRVVPDKRIRVY